jgi:5-(carboxyamino)imidazole ribonucleotide mutase
LKYKTLIFNLMNAKVSIIMGSTSDLPVMKEAADILNELAIPFEINALSAHRTPQQAMDFARNAYKRGIKVIIAGAGGAAHLPGVIASWTTLPVIGVPLASSELKGVDALYSIVQMPGGIPVACVSVGSWGVKNAAHLAAEILGLKYNSIREAYEKYRTELSRS